jgi:hypothetical protein
MTLLPAIGRSSQSVMLERLVVSLTAGIPVVKEQSQRVKEAELERIAYPFREPGHSRPAERGDTGEFDQPSV